MNYSEAILAGCQLRPRQCQGTWFEEGASCAEASALEAIFDVHSNDDVDRLIANTGYDVTRLLAEATNTPDYEIIPVSGWNDSGLTREAIAAVLQKRGY